MDTLNPKICEKFCKTPKDVPDQNEDRLVVTDSFVAVVDGATSSAPIGGRSGGVVAAEAVADAIAILPVSATVRQFVELATVVLAKRIGAWKDGSIGRPSASVVVWSRHRQEIWRVGDCHFRIDDRNYLGEKPLDRLAYDFRCAVIRARLKLNVTTVEREQMIPTLQQPFMPLVEVQHAFANAADDEPLAYGVLNGEVPPDRFIECYCAAQAQEIVLCSDGFPAPYSTLTEGLAVLEALKRADPVLVRLIPGSRPFPKGCDFFDDTTYVRFAPPCWETAT